MNSRLRSLALGLLAVLAFTTAASALVTEEARVSHGLGTLGKSVSLSGDTLLLGGGDTMNAAAAYRLVAGNWTLEADLVPSDPVTLIGYGTAVALDGDLAAVGAPNFDDATYTDRGAIYVFARTGTTWTQEAKLVFPNTVGSPSGAKLGAALAISGNTLVAGVPSYSSSRGGALIFVRNAGVWTLQQSFLSVATENNAQYGVSVDIDGDYAAIGAPQENSNGTAYYYRRANGVWTQTGLNTGLQSLSQIGAAVAQSGSTALVGAPFSYTTGFLPGPGAAFIGLTGFVIRNPNPADWDDFGRAVALDGDWAVIGTPKDFGTFAGSGSAYAFRRVGSGWSLAGKMTLADLGTNGGAGLSVSVSGNRAAIGTRTGVTYLYTLAFSDPDGDGVPDENDNCPAVSNTNQADTDGDHVGDACDPCTDVDEDGYAREGGSCGPTDCNDAKAAIHPGATDIPRNGIDEDCSGADEPCDHDLTCEAGETCGNCSTDCASGSTPGAVCGNGVCEDGNGEDCRTCPQDCNSLLSGKPNKQYCCGAQTLCSDARCNANGKSCTTVPTVPQSWCCGDSLCSVGEGCGNCALDCTVGAEVCTGGLDENCNGAIDCADGSCASAPACAPPTCKSRGVSCTANSECCSLSCVTSKGKKTCK